MILSSFLEAHPRVAEFSEEKLFEASIDFVRNWLSIRLGDETASVAMVLVAREVVPWELRLTSGHVNPEEFDLRRLSRDHFGRELTFPHRFDVHDSAASTPCNLAGVPLGRYVQGYGGHLFVLTNRELDHKEFSCLREATAFVELVLTGEMVRVLAKMRLGQFRHSLFGPLQGLLSTSRQIVQLARAGVLDRDQLEKLSATVISEGETLRRITEGQKFLSEGRVGLRLRFSPLRPFLLRCVERYRSALQERNIDLNILWESRNDIRVHFDEAALDVALSNILDNASKYAFFNTKVTVGARLSSGYAEIWVEDMGHGISIEDSDLIYEPGTRFVWDDPFRRIGGTGLGLAIAKYILLAHGGDISHQCRQITTKSGPTKPYLVRFTLKLPSGWESLGDSPPNTAARADG